MFDNAENRQKKRGGGSKEKRKPEVEAWGQRQIVTKMKNSGKTRRSKGFHESSVLVSKAGLKSVCTFKTQGIYLHIIGEAEFRADKIDKAHIFLFQTRNFKQHHFMLT